MQAAKKAVETIKETAANIGASAMSGLEKTKAVVQEKTERMSASDPVQKDMATEKKEERINQAEMEKQQARDHNAAVKESATGPDAATHTATGQGQSMGANQMPAIHGHGHGTGLAHELLTADVAGPHTTGANTGMGSTAAHKLNVVGGPGPRSGPI